MLRRKMLNSMTLMMALLLTGTASFGQSLSDIQESIKEKGQKWIAGETSISRLPDNEKRRHLGLIKHGVDEIYKNDAYHSLSIQGYSVSPEMIEKVRQGNWSPEDNEEDRKSRDELLARGYWQAFQLVKAAIQKVIVGENPGTLARTAHKEWYRELFQPCVRASLIDAGALARYRNIPVYLRNSRHVPPRWEVVRDAMPALFDLLEQETEPGVRAVLDLLKSSGLTPKRTSPLSPWQNGVAERWIRSCRSDLLDHVILLNEAHLRRLMQDYISYYHADRIHDSLEKDSPATRPISNKPDQCARLVSLPRVGGLHHRYDWQQAA